MYRAMVVDDEKWTLLGICRTFSWEAHGFAPPEKQTDPEAALTSLLASPPDVAFVDIRMPAMTGLELIAAARGRGVASEFVILSGLQDFEYARTAMQYAVFDYLLKPLHADAADRLLARLQAHLDGLDRSPRAAAALSQVHARLVGAAAPSGEGDGADAFTQLVNYVEANLSSPLLLKDVAARFYLTPNYVSALFRQRLDTTFSAHLNRLRIQKAQTLLRGTRMTVEEIARSCGYADAPYFSRVFRQATGETPMRYRRGEEK